MGNQEGYRVGGGVDADGSGDSKEINKGHGADVEDAKEDNRRRKIREENGGRRPVRRRVVRPRLGMNGRGTYRETSWQLELRRTYNGLRIIAWVITAHACDSFSLSQVPNHDSLGPSAVVTAAQAVG